MEVDNVFMSLWVSTLEIKIEVNMTKFGSSNQNNVGYYPKKKKKQCRVK